MKRQPHVVLGVTGSIAAYKAAELVRLMTRRGWEVSVILTANGARFVGAATFRSLSGRPVGQGLFDEPDAWQPEHLSYAERADVLLIAPCSANMLAKLAHGLADDLLSCTALATRAQVVIAPAMHANMWLHPATRANVELLRSRGVVIVDVGEGELACGARGPGRLADAERILAAVAGALRRGAAGKRRRRP